MRLMDHADRFRLPILTFIDTPGAYAGLEAEEQGQGEAIAVNLREMFRLRVPVIATVIGEGGSGGALGIGVADRLLMFEHSVYTVASPEACASILWRDAARRRMQRQPCGSPVAICWSWEWWMRCSRSPPVATTGRRARSGRTCGGDRALISDELLSLSNSSCAMRVTPNSGPWGASSKKRHRMSRKRLKVSRFANGFCQRL